MTPPNLPRTPRTRILAVALTITCVASTVFALHDSAGAIPADTLLGASPDYSSSSDVEAQTKRFEREVAEHQLGAIRLYHAWDELFPQGSEAFLRHRATVPVLSIKTQTASGARISWASIANAQYADPVHRQMREWADSLEAFGGHVIVTIDHEPDHYRNGGTGKAADYVKAMQRFVSILRSRGADNVETAFIGVAWNFDPRSNTDATAYYPGDNFIDWLGTDGYNWGRCRADASGWRSAEQVFQAFIDWATTRPGKRFLLGEFGSVEGSAGQKAQWIADFGKTLDKPGWKRIDIALWWNRQHESDRGCDFRVETSSSAQQAFARLFDQVGAPEPDPVESPGATDKRRQTAETVSRTSVQSRRRGASSGWDGVYCAMYQQVTGEANCALS